MLDHRVARCLSPGQEPEPFVAAVNTRAVRGTDSHPLNLWRIVHFTAERDDSLIERQMTDTGAAEWLRGFIAIYVETALGIKLTPR